MKNIIGGFIMALFAVCLALPNLVFAGAEGATASGSFKFLLQDGETRYVEFKASELADGTGSGEMTLSDPAAIPVDDPDNPEQPKTQGVIVRAKFDCMETDKNTAIMGGEIFESNVPSAIGQRVLLIVQDNGIDGERDQLSWGMYQQPAKGWIPTDAELDDDKGASLTWWATDAERRDDVGIPMPPNKLVQCKTFPGGAYDFPEIKYAGGDMQVTTRQ
ncbi:MAG TPA: hypothetical protein VFS90_12820 [Pyrinomonadaceae bacterium]|nr:hypothetical protein [Pyrinomonadaceae bacterium]